MDSKSERWALFWCHLLHDLLFDELSPGERGRRLRELASKPVDFPDGHSRAPSLSTLRRKLRKYQNKGFDALERKPRGDRGASRASNAPLIARAIELKKDLPSRGYRTLSKMLELEFGRSLPKTTLYRHLKQAGATRRQLGATSKAVRKTWGRSHSHELWIGDFSHGPYVRLEDRTVATRLSVFLDIFSRHVVEAHYYYDEKLDVLCDSLLRALATHGAPAAIYLDNAKVYRSHALSAFCLRLKIQRLHRKPRDPEGGGAVERMIETIQDQFETEVRAREILTLDELNRSLAAWLDVSYHDAVHSATGQAPRERLESGRRARRDVDLQAAVESFYRAETRTVHPDYSDVRVDNVYYRVDQKLRTLKVEVRCPLLQLGESVLIYDLRGGYLGKGERHQRQEGEIVTPEVPDKAQVDVLDQLRKEHDRRVADRASTLAFRNLPRKSTAADFLTHLARYLGRHGLSDFTTREVEAALAFIRNRSVAAPLIARAVEQVGDRNLFDVLRELERLLEKGS